ncbi:hypothetical protein FF80_01809 [Devosia sp. LC5]|nr:hypothetical protein FF80_01809 [Devosia sp. LC5]
MAAAGTGAGGAFLDFSDGLGDLADDGAQNGNIGLDAFKAPPGIQICQRIDALAQHGAGLGVGGEEAREIFNGFFEPAFGTLAQAAFEQDHADAAKDHRGENCFGRGERQAEIGDGANAGRCKPDECVNQCLHGRT